MRSEEPPTWTFYVEAFFAATFFLEVLLRIFSDGRFFFLGAGLRGWASHLRVRFVALEPSLKKAICRWHVPVRRSTVVPDRTSGRALRFRKVRGLQCRACHEGQEDRNFSKATFRLSDLFFVARRRAERLKHGRNDFEP